MKKRRAHDYATDPTIVEESQVNETAFSARGNQARLEELGLGKDAASQGGADYHDIQLAQLRCAYQSVYKTSTHTEDFKADLTNFVQNGLDGERDGAGWQALRAIGVLPSIMNGLLLSMGLDTISGVGSFMSGHCGQDEE